MHVDNVRRTGEMYRARSVYSGSQRAGRSGDRIPVVARYSATVQTCRGAHPTCKVGNGSLSPEVIGQGVTLTKHPHLAPRLKSKGKAVPLQAWSGPEGSRKLRFPDFMTTAQDGGKVVSPTHRPPLPPGNTPGTHFCQRLSRPQGHSAKGRIFMSMKNSSDTTWNRTSHLPIFAQHLNHCATAFPMRLTNTLSVFPQKMV